VPSLLPTAICGDRPGGRRRRGFRGRNALRHRLQAGAILFIWLLATGVHWDVTQVFAWGRMFSRYAETMTVPQAAKKTFSGEMCSLCKAVNSAKKQEQKSPLPPDLLKGKLVMVCPAVPMFFLSRQHDPSWAEREPHWVSIDRDAPPPPPPRGRNLIA